MAFAYNYQAPDLASTLSNLNQEFAANDYGHQSNKKWYRKYRSWADYWRDVTKGALLNDYGTPTDPLAQLQQQLLGQYEQNKVVTPYAENFDFSKMINARNQGAAALLQQRQANIGVPGAYQPAMDVAQRARQTLIDQSLAAYRPQAYQQNLQYQQSQDQLLEALAKAGIETRATIEGAGRSA